MIAHLISLMVFLPLVFAVVLLFIPKSKDLLYRPLALAGVGVQLLLSLLMLGNYLSGKDAPIGVNQISGYQFVEQYDWIHLKLGSLGQLSVQYFVGIDGINIAMILLSALVMFLAIYGSWGIKQQTKGYYALMLLLSSTIMGCFVALDFFLFYVFFEFMLLPMYFLIGIWGGPRREYAAIKFFLYTLFGSVLILLVMIGLYSSVIDPHMTAVAMGWAQDFKSVDSATLLKVQQALSNQLIPSQQMVRSFNLVHMMDGANFIPSAIFTLGNSATLLGLSYRLWAFLLLFIGFGIKLPMVPFHTWLPDAHVEAPTPVSVVLAGILLKIGGYGLLRTAYSIFPDAAIHWAWLVGFMGMLSIIYGAMNALAQKDLKQLIAYSSVSHMGFVLLGLASGTAEGVSGAIYQMFSHGLISALLFLIAGFIYDRTHDRMIENYSGLAQKLPYFTTFVIIGFFASLGLPAFSGFIAEVFVFLGAFSSQGINGLIPRWMAIVSLLGLLLGAAYYLWTLQRMFFGKYFVRKAAWEVQMTDMTLKEYIVMTPLVVCALLFGIFPSLLLDLINGSVAAWVHLVMGA
ncbi:NADH-quinone oxidoreductase subunit M [Persicobacter psychrovividus]|uniref:Oxidoreductase n=1 Tax=Persicobacter psychrovividus TaxID=387638 RepID=A0ABM7VFF5_9BACT|nr:oxidoreductase [Persicobacter psychrovividus]